MLSNISKYSRDRPGCPFFERNFQMTTLRLSLNWNLWYSYLWSQWSNTSITPWFAYVTLMHNNEKYHDENAIIIVAANVVLSLKNTTIPKSTVVRH